MRTISQKGNIKVVLEGKGPLTLRPSNYIAAGGEGSVYVAGDTAIKIYQDPKNKIPWNRVPEKVSFFKQHKHPYVVAPQGLVMDPVGEVLGYYMPYVKDIDHGGNAEPIARVFTNDGRLRLGLTETDSSTLVERMREIILFAHANNAITVDANELGYFVVPKGKGGPEPRMIDVDCWVLDGKKPPTLPIMPSIRDWHSKTPFGEEQDWFAWAVVTFQVYVGLHPYKGSLDGYLPKDLELRMKKNLSVFEPNIRLNRAVRDFSSIPDALLEWYEATFKQGERSIPPSPFDVKKVARAAKTLRVISGTSSGNLIFKKLYENTSDPVVRVYFCGVALLASGTLINLETMRSIGKTSSLNCEVIRGEDGWLKAIGGGVEKIVLSFIHESSLKEEVLSFATTSHRLVRYLNRLFIVTDRGLSELIVHVFGKPICSIGQTWGAMVNSTHWYDGVGVQDTLGAQYIIVPFGDSSCAQVRVPELDELTIVGATSGNRFVALIGMDTLGQYHKVELAFDKDYKTYTILTNIVDSPDHLNMAILPKGVCVSIVEDGILSVFVPSNGKLNTVKDKQIATYMSLTTWGDKVTYTEEGAVWSLQMK